jgi:pantothenate synthetase
MQPTLKPVKQEIATRIALVEASVTDLKDALAETARTLALMVDSQAKALALTLETRLSLLEASLEERRKSIEAITTKIDRLTYAALFSAVAFLADIVFEKLGLISFVRH